MPYKISDGIPESELAAWLAEAREKYGLYQGRGVNYSKADLAPIVMCTVVCSNEILLVKRAHDLADAEGYWSTVNGYIDQPITVKEIAQQELQEELGLRVSTDAIKVASSYTLENPAEKRKYIVFPCLITVDEKPAIVLDREHTEYTWTTRNRLETFDALDDLPYAIDTVLSLASTP